jgi:predicted O-methyltransferase YrrM
MTQDKVFSTDPISEETARRVFEDYHERIEAERSGPRIEAPGGRDGGHDQRMRAIGPETGRLLHSIVSSLKSPRVLEVGTSFGYSTLWLAHAAWQAKGEVTTIEKHAYKSAYARDMAERARLDTVIRFHVDDALECIGRMEGPFDFVFIDLWKELYVSTLEALLPKLTSGAIVVADNMLRPSSEAVSAYASLVRSMPGVRSLTIPVGTGVEISVFGTDHSA